MSQLCEIYSTNNPHQAEVIQAALADAGIPATISGTPLWAAVGDLPAAAIALKIQVAEEHQAAARLIALEYDDPQVKNIGPDWTCYNCGEVNAASFDCCWQCHCDHVATTDEPA